MARFRNWLSRHSMTLVYFGVVALVLFRTLPYEIFGREVLDSDEAIFALMAKHLSVGKAFPIFAYHQKYLFGQISWLAAPLFILFGPSVAMYRLPLLLINVAVGLLMVFLLKRDARLKPWEAWICSLWFLLPSVRSARGLTNGCDGAIEPYLYLLVIWMLRRRPFLAGVIAGIGMECRPFVFYGVTAILVLELARDRDIKAFLQKCVIWASGIAVSIAAIQIAARFSTGYTGGNAPLYLKSVRHMLEDVRGYFAEIIPQTIGLETQRWFLTPGSPGMDNHWNVYTLALAVIGAVLFAFLLRQLVKKGIPGLEGWIADESLQFPIYLILIGLLTFTAYVVLSPPSDDIRYTFTLILGFVGIYALQRRVGTSARLWYGSLAFVLGVSASNLWMNGRSWFDLAKIEHAGHATSLLDYLRKNHVHVAAATDYWTSNNLTFLSNEEIVVTTGSGNIPQSVETLKKTPPQEVAWVSPTPCPGRAG